MFQINSGEGAGEKKRESLVLVAPMILEQNIIKKNKGDHTHSVHTRAHIVLFGHTMS